MTALVVLLAVVVALLTILVVGLLRSYGEVLRRLHEAGIGVDGQVPAAARGTATPASAVEEAADIARRLDAGVAPPRQGVDESFLPEVVDVAGVTPDGDAVGVGLRSSGRVTMLAFLSSGCGTCAGFWAALRAGEGLAVNGQDVRLVVVTGGPRNEQPAVVASLAGPDLVVVMSDEAWQHYAVPATPYFVLVDGGQGILGEGSAMGWSQLVGLMERAVRERGFELQTWTGSSGAPGGGAHRAGGAARGETGPPREARADAALLAAGIGPGDDQLYRNPLDAPGGAESEPGNDGPPGAADLAR